MARKLTFIDLFAGIGGFHIAFSKLAKCVWACEWDEYARHTYEHNFKSKHPAIFRKGRFFGDIKEIDYENVPDFDVLTAGFPCQPFSQAGQKRGFEEARGTLFYEIREILEKKEPAAYFLENVRHLENHDNGRTLEIIENHLKKLKYGFRPKIVKASDFGLPTHRPRLFMVGFKNDPHNKIPFEFPKPKGKLDFTMSDVLGGECTREIGFTLRVGGRASGIKDRRNWDAYMVDDKVRRLTPTEGLKMMGFPKDFTFPESISEAQAMKQLGNSVAIPAVQATARNIIKVVKKYYD